LATTSLIRDSEAGKWPPAIVSRFSGYPEGHPGQCL
jgi:hypothetical protein